MFEHVHEWGTRGQKQWFAWQRLEHASKRRKLPIVCLRCHSEIKGFEAFLKHQAAGVCAETEGPMFGVSGVVQLELGL